MNNTAVDIHVQIFVWTLVLILLNIYLRVSCWGHMVTLYLTIWRIAKLFYKVDVPFCIHTNTVRGFQFLYILTNTCECLYYSHLSWSVSAAITKIPETEWLKQHLFLIVLMAAKSKIKVPADSVLVRAVFLIYRWPSPCFLLMWRREIVSLMSILIRTLISFSRVPS